MTSNADFTEWVGVLREGVTFHNGTEVTAQTIADMFPVQQEGSQSSSQIAASNLGDVQATGDYEVTYTMNQPNSAFPAYLSRAQLGLVFDPELAAADPDGYNENPIGTGPFQFVSRDLDNETVLERNPNYWLSDSDGTQLPYLDESHSARFLMKTPVSMRCFRARPMSPIRCVRARFRDARNARDEGDDIFLYEFQGNNVGGGMFNVLVPPFDDVRVRRGLTMMNSQGQRDRSTWWHWYFATWQPVVQPRVAVVLREGCGLVASVRL